MLSSQVFKSTRPILRWAGSKRKLLPKLMACAPDNFERYIEPFLGSACYFLALKPKKAVLGDFNTELIEMYKILSKQPEKVAELVHAMPNTSEFYYQIRSQSSKELNSIDRAARFIYLNRYCFNGVYRSNRSGQFNVPRGKHTGQVPTIEEFVSCGNAFRAADLRPGDFENCLSGIQQGDFIYLDPPYASVSRLDHGEYGYGSFNEGDINRLINSLIDADQKGAIVLLSYANTPIFKEKLPNWHFRKIRVQRFVAGFSYQRHQVKELLISNQPLPLHLDKIK